MCTKLINYCSRKTYKFNPTIKALYTYKTHTKNNK